jgi:site-specific recombinase XerD
MSLKQLQKKNRNRQNDLFILSQSPVSKKPKKQLAKPVRRKTLPLREAISAEIYEFLMNQQKPVNVTDFAWARNRVTITILRISGLRVNEARVLTWKQLQDSFKTKKLQIYESKTNTYREVPLTDAGLAILKE